MFGVIVNKVILFLKRYIVNIRFGKINYFLIVIKNLKLVVKKNLGLFFDKV